MDCNLAVVRVGTNSHCYDDNEDKLLRTGELKPGRDLEWSHKDTPHASLSTELSESNIFQDEELPMGGGHSRQLHSVSYPIGMTPHMNLQRGTMPYTDELLKHDVAGEYCRTAELPM